MPNSSLPWPQVETIPAVPSSDADTQQQAALIQSLLLTVHHFFGGFARLFRAVHDPRHPMHITYPLVALLSAPLEQIQHIWSYPCPSGQLHFTKLTRGFVRLVCG